MEILVGTSISSEWEWLQKTASLPCSSFPFLLITRHFPAVIKVSGTHGMQRAGGISSLKLMLSDWTNRRQGCLREEGSPASPHSSGSADIDSLCLWIQTQNPWLQLAVLLTKSTLAPLWPRFSHWWLALWGVLQPFLQGSQTLLFNLTLSWLDFVLLPWVYFLKAA